MEIDHQISGSDMGDQFVGEELFVADGSRMMVTDPVEIVIDVPFLLLCGTRVADSDQCDSSVRDGSCLEVRSDLLDGNHSARFVAMDSSSDEQMRSWE